MSGNAVLEISEVCQAFRSGFWMKKATVLDGLSFQVPSRSIFGFLGANGAGKTTLIHLIAGLKKPVSGSVRLFGHEATSAEARARLGYLPERPYFHEHLTGEALLRYFGALSGMKTGQIRSRIPVVLKAVGMEEARSKELRHYSKGMLQRIGIAQALLHDPEFLVLDEPMSGLDPLGRKEMRDLILLLSDEGRTVFFSSHVIPDVEAICDQVAVIQKGRLIGSGDIQSLLTHGVSASTEIGFSGVPGLEVSGLPGCSSLREAPDAFRAVISDQQSVQEALAKLMALQAKILWVTPIRPSLESLFSKEGIS
jgi:ABC-2 type transport system ATP-binding protein